MSQNGKDKKTTKGTGRGIDMMSPPVPGNNNRPDTELVPDYILDNYKNMANQSANEHNQRAKGIRNQNDAYRKSRVMEGIAQNIGHMANSTMEAMASGDVVNLVKGFMQAAVQSALRGLSGKQMHKGMLKEMGADQGNSLVDAITTSSDADKGKEKDMKMSLSPSPAGGKGPGI